MEQKLTTKEEYLKRINVIVEYINNHLDENIDLGMLAEMSGFSPWHFHRIVRAFLGEPVGAFITRVRVETALACYAIPICPCRILLIGSGMTCLLLCRKVSSNSMVFRRMDTVIIKITR